jgi:branched-chain amino acid transport system permease protein
MLDFIQVIVSGLLIGSVYALLAVGLTLLFGVVRVINFAHGELVMIGMYVSFWIFVGTHINPYLSIIAVIPALFLIGMILQRIVIQPIQETSAMMKVFVTCGLFIALQNLALMLFKGDYRTIQTGISMATLNVSGISISLSRLVAFGAAVIIFGVLYLFLKYTFTGKALRAVAESRDIARLMGIRVERLYLLTFGLSAALAGIAGAFLLPFTCCYPTIGGIYTLVAFVVVVLGGLGSMAGAFLGGLFIGLVESVSGTYVSPAMKEASYFLIFILVLLVRPQGLFGKGKGTEIVGLK